MAKKHKKDPEHFKIKRNRNGREHIDSCGSGYLGVSSKYTNIHHIVCISCVSDSTISDQLEEDAEKIDFIKNCLAETNWNINEAHNCIGLPLKRAFVHRSPKRWDGYPCHQVEHNPKYTHAVSAYLKDNVWESSIEEAEECEFDAKSLRAQLRAGSTKWRNFLTARGQGTAHCWKNRHEMPDSWYIPFSMNPGTPATRKAPPDWSAFSGPLKNYLANMFKMIK